MIAPVALLRKLTTLHAAASSDLKRGAVETSDSVGRKLTCAAGCSYCCNQKIVVTAAEGFAIYLYFRENGQWTSELEAKLIKADKEMTERDHLTWFEEQRPCPFLDSQEHGHGRCTVYEVRPIACASTFSDGGNPVNCSVSGKLPDHRGAFQVVVTSPNVSQYLMLMALMRQYVDPGRGMVLMTLPGAVLWAAAHLENRPAPDVKRMVYHGDVERFDDCATFKKESV